MIRFNTLLSVLLFCFLFAGCADDAVSPADGKGGMTYLQVRVPRTAAGTRTIGMPVIPGTQEENVISDATIYLINGDRIIKVDQVAMQRLSDSYVSGLIPVERDMLNQEFQLFVVANPAKAGLYLRTTEGFKGLYATRDDTYKLLTPGQMLMSNQVEQSPAPTVVITRENTKDNPAKVEVHLDRLAAKVEPRVAVGFKADFTYRPEEEAFFDGFTFSVEGAGLLNAATEFNLEQLWGEPAAGQPIQLLSPTWYYKPEEQYFSRYYSTINDYTGAGAPPFVSFNKASENGYYLISSPFYCLENNSPFYDYTGSALSPESQVKTKYKGLTTGVVFRVQATKDGSAADFYRYEGKYYADTESERLALAEAAELEPADFESASALRKKRVKVYEDGNIYYTYWIKDENPAYSGDDYDLSYAVIRNSCYKLNVLGLTIIGNDTPGGGYEPGEPIDKIDQIEIVAVCQNWATFEVAHDFN